MRRRGGKEDRPGWAKAPSLVEVEIRTVWQEDEMPDEIKNEPGYHTFTLSAEAQEWVDSMSEVVDGGNAVYGRPKPVTPTQHRQLATPAPPDFSPQSPAPQSTFPSRISRRSSPPEPRILIPDIDDVRPAARPHASMPEIDEPSAPHKSPVLMPDIDGFPPPCPRTLPERVSMPDIGEEQPATEKPPSMPYIGEEQQRSKAKPPSMPDIG